MAGEMYNIILDYDAGKARVEFVNAGGKIMLVVDIDKRPPNEQGKHVVTDKSIAGMRARNLAAALVEYWDRG